MLYSSDAVDIRESVQLMDNPSRVSAVHVSLGEDLTTSGINDLKTISCSSELFPFKPNDVNSCILLADSFVNNNDDANGRSGITTKVKCKRRRERNVDPSPPDTILPPCRICDEKSSGYHYGANTCEACKGFFRRALKKKKVEYSCKCTAEERNLWKIGPYKNGCPSCRYERCLSAGMSRNAIKIGRYTLNHKTKNIEEVKSLESVDSIIEDAFSQALMMNSPHDGDERSILEISASTPDGPQHSPRMLAADRTTKYPSALNSASKQKHGNNVSSVVTLKEIDTIVNVLTEAHTLLEFYDQTPNSPEFIEQKHAEYLEKYHLKTQIFGALPALTMEEFLEFYKSTGIDVDGRIVEIEFFLQFFQRKIAAIVAFAKAIPGFRQLCLDDQSNLVKVSRVESVMIAAYRSILRNVNRDLNVATTPWGNTCHINELTKVFPSLDIILERLKFSERLKKLDLTIQEEAILRAIVTTFSDRGPLSEPKKIDAIQEKLIICLERLLGERASGSRPLLYKIIDIVTDMRGLSEQAKEMEKRMLVDWSFLSLQNYALIREFMS